MRYCKKCGKPETAKAYGCKCDICPMSIRQELFLAESCLALLMSQNESCVLYRLINARAIKHWQCKILDLQRRISPTPSLFGE